MGGRMKGVGGRMKGVGGKREGVVGKPEGGEGVGRTECVVKGVKESDKYI